MILKSFHQRETENVVGFKPHNVALLLEQVNKNERNRNKWKCFKP